MNIVLSTIGQQVIAQAKDGGYKLEIGYVRVFRTGVPEANLPVMLSTSMVDSNIQSSWTALGTNVTALDEFNSESPDIFQMVATLPSSMGDFQFDAIGVYLKDNTLMGLGCYERLVDKITPGQTKTANQLELSIFMRYASIADTIKVTRKTALRPYSRIVEFDKTDKLGSALDNSDRIYRITRPSNAMGAGKDVFTTFLVHAGYLFSDNQNKPYQRAIWVPSDHMSMFGSENLTARLLNANTLEILVPKNTYPMIEHIQAEVPYLIATTSLLQTIPPIGLRGLLLEATLSVIAEGTQYYSIRFNLTGSTFTDNTLWNTDFGVKLYASNSDLSAQTAVRVAIKKFLELQYKIGRRYASDDPTDPNDVLMPFLGYRTYWQKLNGVVEVATSTTDGRIASPGQLYDLPDYATGGETLLAPVLRATNVWLRYDPSSSGSITYDLSADRTTVNEGGTINFTLRTTGLTNGSQVTYNITGIQKEDLSGSNASLTGVFTIQNNVGVVSLNIKADETTEGPETLRLTIQQDPSIFVEVIINDTSVSLDVQAFYGIESTATTGVSQINEGDTRFFIAICTGISDGTYLYPSILQSSQATASDIAQAIPSNVRVLDGRISFPLTLVADKITEGDETLSIGLYRDPSRTDVLVSASVLIKDTSRAATLSAKFSSLSTGNNTISGDTVNEGTFVYLVIETTGYNPNTVVGLRYGNSATPSLTEVSENDFGTTRPTTATIDANGKAIVGYYIQNDYTQDRAAIDTLETFTVEVISRDDIPVLLARTMVYIKDTSTVTGGTFTLLDITDSAAPTLVYDLATDEVAESSPSSTKLGGARNDYIIAGNVAPIDIGIQVARRYRLVWIQGPTTSTIVTRALLDLANIISYGVGIGSSDATSATSGKALSMLKDAANNDIGYGCIFEFEVDTTALPQGISLNSLVQLSVKTYYANGVPGSSITNPTPADKWVLSRKTLIPIRENGSIAKIKNAYSKTIDGQYSLYSKEVIVPFGAYVDLMLISPSGAGGSSAPESSGTGATGSNGRNLSINVPQYMGKSILKSEQPSTGTTPDPITWTANMLWKSLLTISGGTGGKGQDFDSASTLLGGDGSTYVLDPNLTSTLNSLKDAKLFARVGNQSVAYEIICEILYVVQNKSFQKGQSTATNSSGGKGFLPIGSVVSPDNIAGAGGAGGASKSLGGTNKGYAGGGGSGLLMYIRLGTKVLDSLYKPSPTLAPVSFFITDTDAYAAPTSDPSNTRLPFYPAQPVAVTGGNIGIVGSELAVVQADYSANALRSITKQLLINSGTPLVFVRPTHNAVTAVTLPIKTQTTWDSKQLNQVAIPKFSTSRLVLMATGVEGSYTNANSQVVNGKPSKASNLILSNTLDPNETANESLGSTLVYSASSAANAVGGVPVINTSKLSVIPNTVISQQSAIAGSKTGTVNTYSWGGTADLYISNHSTSAKAFFAELPRVNISDDNPNKVIDTNPYDPNNTWSTETDSDGNSISSYGYKLAVGDGALSVQPYSIGNISSLRPWIPLKPKDSSMTDTDAPIILQQGQAVVITVVGGGGTVSTRVPDAGVTTSDPAFNGTALSLSMKSVSDNTYTTFLTCDGGKGSIDNSTEPTPATSLPALDMSVIGNYLTVIGTPEYFVGADNPIKSSHGGNGSGSYAKFTFLNHYPNPIAIKATGGQSGSYTTATGLTIADGIVLLSTL